MMQFKPGDRVIIDDEFSPWHQKTGTVAKLYPYTVRISLDDSTYIDPVTKNRLHHQVNVKSEFLRLMASNEH